MFRIGEFSKLTQVSVRMLRYYDEAGLLAPAEIDSRTGYRLYSAEQIPDLNKILYLRDSGFHVSEIAMALKSGDPAHLVKHLDRKHLEIERNIQAEQEKLHKLETAKNQLLYGKDERHYHVFVKSVPGYFVLSVRRVIPDYYAEEDLWNELAVYAKQNRIALSDETFSIYYDEDYREKNVDVELCTLVKKAGQSTGCFTFRHTEPVPAMACTMVYGEFSNIAGAYHSFAEWLQTNSQYKMRGANRQIVHRGPWNENNPQKYLTELQIPLEKIS